MELLQLKYFSHAAKSENFSHTAQKFRVPTSGISASIKKLENEIGVNLFDRTSNRVKLNEYGKILLKAVDKSDELLKKAKADIFDLSQNPPGELKLLVLANRQKITQAISELRIKHPNISFNIKHQYDFDEKNINTFDVIIADQSVNSEYFNEEFWLREEIFLAVHKDNQLSHHTSVSTKQLKNEKFICMPKSSSLRNCMDNFFRQNNIDPIIAIECDDPQYIRKYIKIGLGVTLFPSISWKDQINDDIKLLKINDGLYRDSYICTNKTASGMARLFSKMLSAIQ